jgi:hypothetical protein
MRKGKDPEPHPDPYLWLIDPDRGGPKTCGSRGSGSPTLFFSIISSLLQEVFWSVGNKRAELRMKTKPMKNTGQALHVLHFYPCSISTLYLGLRSFDDAVMSLYDVQCACKFDLLCMTRQHASNVHDSQPNLLL